MTLHHCSHSTMEPFTTDFLIEDHTPYQNSHDIQTLKLMTVVGFEPHRSIGRYENETIHVTDNRFSGSLPEQTELQTFF